MQRMNDFRLTKSASFLLLAAVAVWGVWIEARAQKAAPVAPKMTRETAVSAPASTAVNDAPPSEADLTRGTPSDPPEAKARFNYTSSPEFFLALMVCGISISALLMQFLLLKKSSKPKCEDTSQVFGLTLIIMGALFSVSAGFSAEQIAPTMGLFGTIAGYLLGKSEKKEREDNA